MSVQVYDGDGERAGRAKVRARAADDEADARAPIWLVKTNQLGILRSSGCINADGDWSTFMGNAKLMPRDEAITIAEEEQARNPWWCIVVAKWTPDGICE